MGAVIRLSETPEIANDSGRWQPLNKRLGITAFGAVPGEPHPYGEWITEAAAEQ